MDMQSKLEIYKEIHYREIERKLEVTERTKWLLSMWILLLGVIIFCFQNYYKVEPNLKQIFIILIVFTIALTLVSGVLLGTCFSKKPYAHLPAPSTLENYIQNNPQDNLEEVLVEAFSDAYDLNFKKNNELISKLIDCSHLMIASVILVFFCFLCIAPNWIEKEEPVQKIEIIEGGETND